MERENGFRLVFQIFPSTMIQLHFVIYAWPRTFSCVHPLNADRLTGKDKHPFFSLSRDQTGGDTNYMTNISPLRHFQRVVILYWNINLWRDQA